jgi:cation transport ATPase
MPTRPTLTRPTPTRTAAPSGKQSELIFALLAGVAVLAGWVLGRWSAAAPGVSLACYIAAYLLGGYFTSREALENTRARRFEIDTLMLVAAAGAAALGKWAEGALLLFLFSSATRWSTMRWVGHAAPSRRWPRSPRSGRCCAGATHRGSGGRGTPDR